MFIDICGVIPSSSVFSYEYVVSLQSFHLHEKIHDQGEML